MRKLGKLNPHQSRVFWIAVMTGETTFSAWDSCGCTRLTTIRGGHIIGSKEMGSGRLVANQGGKSPTKGGGSITGWAGLLPDVRPMSTHPLEKILHPRSIAVVGASGNPDALGYGFTRHLLDYGYRGRIYPINPNYSEVLGIKAYPSLNEVPDSVDYVISCIPASAVLGMLRDASQKGVRAVHLFTGRFSETGRKEAADLEREILKQARASGIRLIGPNCMGLYYPREGVSFGYDFPKEPGPVGLASQSGGGATYFIHLASLRGIRFSKVISYGNALDFNECDFLDYFAQDTETEIILLYVEGATSGRRFFDTLRRAAASKPVIVVKGGRGKAGMRAAASHTAALASSMRTWESLVAQAGAISAQDFDEMADLAVSFRYLPRIRGARVGIVGVGGGPSVLAADQCEEAGLDVIPLPTEIREELRNRNVPIWDWIGNPTDVSIVGGFITGVEMLQMMAKNQSFDLLIGIINEDAPAVKAGMIGRMRTDVKGYIKVKKECLKPLLAVVGEKGPGLKDHNHWRCRMLSEARTKLLAATIPVYPTVGRAARAARKLVDFYRRREQNHL